MKRLMTFENFVNTENTNEYFGQKFLTGHGPGEKEIAVKRIESEIENALEKLRKNPESFKSYKEEILKEQLLKAAKENGYRGKVVIQKAGGDPRAVDAGKYHIVYRPATSGLQNVGTAAAAGTRVMANY